MATDPPVDGPQPVNGPILLLRLNEIQSQLRTLQANLVRLDAAVEGSSSKGQLQVIVFRSPQESAAAGPASLPLILIPGDAAYEASEAKLSDSSQAGAKQDAGQVITYLETLQSALRHQVARVNEALASLASESQKFQDHRLDEPIYDEDGNPILFIDHPDASLSPAGDGAKGIQRYNKMTSEERRRSRADRWKLIDQIEEENIKSDEEAADIQDSEETSSTPALAEQASRELIHERVSSAERPAPKKSALKHSRPRSAFGSAGFKRGFLNLNPSSPAAELASNPLSDDEDSGDRSTDRMSRSEELNPKGKRRVRIKSPDAPRRSVSGSNAKRQPILLPAPPGMMSDNQTTGNSSGKLLPVPRDLEDEGVEDEAAKIVQLLGPENLLGEVIHDEHSLSAPGRREVARPSSSTSASKLSRKPPVSDTVVERLPGSSTEVPNGPSLATETARKPSAFKSGFLKPMAPLASPSAADAPISTALPVAPQQTHNVSALDRAVRADAPLEKARMQAGLTPAVPHARPSKAYAAKLAQREAGKTGDDQGTAGGHVLAQPGKGDDVSASGRVRFATTTDCVVTSEPQSDSGVVVVESAATRGVDEAADDGSEERALRTGEVWEIEDEGDASDGSGALQDYSSGNDDEDDFDDSDGYGSEDLAALAPSFDSMAEDFEDAELAREYELVKARWLTSSNSLAQHLARTTGKEDEDSEGEDLSVPLPNDAHYGDGSNASKPTRSSGQSRFRANRLARSTESAPAQADPNVAEDEVGSDELARLLLEAKNVGPAPGAGETMQPPAGAVRGPSLVIPLLERVRYPEDSFEQQDEMRGPVGLEATSADEDDDDERLAQTMLVRLQRQKDREQSRASGKGAAELAEGNHNAPPVILAAQERHANTPLATSAGAEESASAVSAARSVDETAPKRVSRFKAARTAP